MRCTSPTLAPLVLVRVDPKSFLSYGPKPTPPSAPFSPKARLQVEVKFAPFASGSRRFVPGKVRGSFRAAQSAEVLIAR